MPDGEALAARVDRRAGLPGLAEALTRLAMHMHARAMAAQDFDRLTERAKMIAVQAWDVRTSRWGFVENAGLLADELELFARDAAAASQRAIAETKGNMAVVDALMGQATRIAKLGQDATAEMEDIRAELEPLEIALVTMRAQIEVKGSATEDAAALARQAAELSLFALGLRGGGRQAQEAVAAIARGLTVFIGEASAIATRMAAATSGLGDVVAVMASSAREPKRGYADPVTRVIWS